MMGCPHCSTLDADNSCKRCEIVLQKIAYGRDLLRPDEESLSCVKKALYGVDRGDEKSVWDALLSAAPKVGDIPILGVVENNNLTTKELEKWIHVSNSRVEDMGELSKLRLSFPGDQNYEFTFPECDDEADFVIMMDSWNDWFHGKPLVDLAEMFLENEVDSTSFSQWLEIIEILSILSIRFRGPEQNLNDCFQNHIDRVVPEIISAEDQEDPFFGGFEHYIFSNCIPHPFIRYSAGLINMNSFKIFLTDENRYLPQFWKESGEKLGDIASSWFNIISSGGEISRAEKYTPTLVVSEQRLHLMVRDEHGYSLIRVPQNIEIWGLLISLSLYHPSTEQNSYLRAIQWEIMCEDEPQFVASMPEIRALEFLGETCQSLNEVVEVSNDHFVVKGQSSLYYTVKPVGESPNIGIEVRAFRNKEQTKSSSNGIRICIVFNDFNSLPLGDKIAAYLLVLCNDEDSASNISTLQMLLDSWTQAGSNNKEESWKHMIEVNPHGFQEDEPDWEDEWDYDDETMDEVCDCDCDCSIDSIQEVELDTDNNSQANIDNDTWEIEAAARGEAHCI